MEGTQFAGTISLSLFLSAAVVITALAAVYVAWKAGRAAAWLEEQTFLLRKIAGVSATWICPGCNTTNPNTTIACKACGRGIG